jgi:hypothetical protein
MLTHKIAGKKINLIDLFYLSTAILIAVYVLIRAMFLDITYDEVWTITEFVPLKSADIITCTPCDANNHILNALLIKFIFFLTGNHSVFFARLPNVLAGFFYLYFSYKLCSRFLKPLAGICLFILLSVNPFILDFFGLARGYGLALSLQMCSIYYLLKYYRGNRNAAFISLATSAFAVIGNFSFLSFYVGLFGTIQISALLQKQRNYILFTLINLIISTLLALVIYIPVKQLISANKLYYGGVTNFFHDTILSLLFFSFYKKYNINEVNIIAIVFILLTGIFLLASILSYRRNLTAFARSEAGVILLLCFIPITCNILQFYILGTPFLVDRTALFYYPLFFTMIMFLADQHKKPFSLFANSSAVLITLFILINFLRNANFYKTTTWFFDAHTSKILNALNNKAKTENKILKIDFSWPFEKGIQYYLAKNHYSNLQNVNNMWERDSFNAEADCYIYLKKSLESVNYPAEEQAIKLYKKDTLLTFPAEDIFVFYNIHK